MVGSLENDLQILTKLLSIVIASCPDDAHLIEQQADSAMAMLLQRLLAGRLYEGWNLFRGFSKRFRDEYEADLDAEGQAAVQSLRRYFGSSNSLLAQVRNKIGFHADRSMAEATYEKLSETEDLGSYICDTLGNTLHITPELMHYETICEITKENNYLNAMNILWNDTQNRVSEFNKVLNSFTVLFAIRYLPDAISQLKTEYDDVHAEPMSSFQLRFFSDLSELQRPD